MRIAICASLDFIKEIHEVAVQLRAFGHEVIMPKSAEMALRGEVTSEQIREEKVDGTIVDRTIRQDSIRYYYNSIKGVDAILVLNYTKKGIPNYIGGNVLMEIGFAHVLGKKIFLLNPIPEIEYYKDEIHAMQPVILNGNLTNIR